MKKIYVALLVVSAGLFTTANAQIAKGNVLAGSDIANFRLGLNTGAGYDISLTPKFGFFIHNNAAIGPYVNLGITGYSGGGTTVVYGVGAFGRYYFTGKDNVSPLRHSLFFLEANLGIGGTNYSGGGSTNGLDLGFGPGFSYFITPNVGLEALLKYDANVGFGNVATTSNLDFRFGFQIYLPSKNIRDRVNEMKK